MRFRHTILSLAVIMSCPTYSSDMAHGQSPALLEAFNRSETLLTPRTRGRGGYRRSQPPPGSRASRCARCWATRSSGGPVVRANGGHQITDRGVKRFRARFDEFFQKVREPLFRFHRILGREYPGEGV